MQTSAMLPLELSGFVLQSLYLFMLIPTLGYALLRRVAPQWFSAENPARKLVFSALAGMYMSVLAGIVLGMIGLLSSISLIVFNLCLLLILSWSTGMFSFRDNALVSIVEMWRGKEQRFAIVGILSITLFSAIFTLPFGEYASDTFRIHGNYI